MSVRAVQAILLLAPLLLGLSIGAYFRLRQHVCHSPDPIAFFWHLRWNSGLVVIGGCVMLAGAAGAQALGTLAQVCGFILALEFFYVAYVNLQVIMSARGLLIGMNFLPWNRFAGFTWLSERDLELASRTRRRYRLRVPTHTRASVQEIVDLNILK